MEEEQYVISAWYEENGETHFIFNREIDYSVELLKAFTNPN